MNDGTSGGMPPDADCRTAKPEKSPMLQDIEARKATPKDKPFKLADERGLYLWVNPGGGKLWRLDYRFEGKRGTLALGSYPDVPLADARTRRDDARKLLAQGIDPAAHRKAAKAARQSRAANSFEVVAREWYAKQSRVWAENHRERIIRRLERDLFPWLGARPVSEITAPELLAALRRIESRGALDTAHRALQNCGQIFRFAIATGRGERDIAADLRGALPPVRGGHFPATTEPRQAAALLRAIDSYKGV